MAAGLLHSVVCHLLTRGAPHSVLLTLLPPQPQEVLPTWHDDIRKSQFSCNCQSPIKYHGIFSPNLFHVSTKKLQRNYKTYKNKSIFFLNSESHFYPRKHIKSFFFPPEKNVQNSAFFLRKVLRQKVYIILKRYSRKLIEKQYRKSNFSQ